MLKNLISRPKDLAVFILFIALLLLFILAIIFKPQVNPFYYNDSANYDLKEIKERDTIYALTDNTSTSFFLYKGQPLGYQYELLKEFASEIGVELIIKTESDIETSFEKLHNGEVDVVAIDLTITKQRQEIVDFTTPLSQTQQVLIQRKPEGWEKMRKKELEDTLIRNQLDIGGKTVYIQKNSAFGIRLHNLAEEIGDSIDIKYVDIDTEELITMVAEGKIEYTISDEHVAKANATYHSNIDYGTVISFPQNVAWAVRKTSDSLLLAINTWLDEFKNTRTYRRIYRKYFVSKKSFHHKEPEYHSLRGGKISPYDKTIKKYAEEAGWDWRFVASVMYEESRFNPRAKSWAGAYGLMQLMPVTAKRFGVTNINNVDQQIRGGVRFLTWLSEHVPEDIESEEERMKFVLASYNIGFGHIMDAHRLAVKYNEDATKWSTIEKYMLLKSNPKYYLDPVVKSGYCRGRETKRFVKSVYGRYQNYITIMPDED